MKIQKEGEGGGEEKNTVVWLKNSLQIFPTQQFDEYTLEKRKGRKGGDKERKKKQPHHTVDGCVHGPTC
jgi:hypothetical protein